VAKFGRGNKKEATNPLAFAFHIGNQLIAEGAHIDMVLDLPLTTTIRFTMKESIFRDKVQSLIAWNLETNPVNKIGQVINSYRISNDISSYEIMFIKEFWEEEVKQLSA
jgi:hypothetical protein